MLAVALAAGVSPAFALSLGNAEVSSFLGQPLSMRVPVILDDLSDGSSQCPRIIPLPSYDVPTLAMGRMDIERSLTQIYLRLTTALPVDEPVLRVVLEIGCTQRVRREFTLLLDPPAGIASPAPVVAAAPRIEFGRPQIAGFRGQPLMMTVPIQGELAASLTPACVRTGQSDSTDLPRTLNDAKVALVDQGGGRALRIHTSDPVYESRVRVLVEVGCEQPLRQEFVVLLDAPRLASTPAEAPAPLAAPAPAKRTEKPAVRPSLPARPVLPAPVPAASLSRAELPAVPKTVVPAPIAEPAKATPPQPARTDRLVLAAPEEAPKAPAAGSEIPREPRVDMSPDEREQVLKRLEVLAVEVKTLRAELDASARRNRELSEKARSASYAWAAAAGAALLLGLGIVFGWRNRPRREEPEIDPDKAGPMTRILGKPSEHVPPPTPPAPVVPPAPAMTEGAGPNTVAAILAAHKAAHEHDTQGASTAIMVTEFHNTTQAIGELYSQYVDRNAGNTEDLATQPAPMKLGDLDLSNERTTVLAPNTKTEIAVDIDLDETNTQISRDLQREYERLDLAGRAKDEPVKDSELPTRIGPLTTKLALDLDLDISTIAQSKTPGKGA